MESDSQTNIRDVRFDFLGGKVRYLCQNGQPEPQLREEYPIDGGNILYSYGCKINYGNGRLSDTVCFGDLEDLRFNQGEDYSSTSSVTNRGGRHYGSNFFEVFVDGSRSTRIRRALSRGASRSSEVSLKRVLAGEDQYFKITDNDSYRLFLGDEVLVRASPERMREDVGGIDYVEREFHFRLTENTDLSQKAKR